MHAAFMLSSSMHDHPATVQCYIVNSLVLIVQPALVSQKILSYLGRKDFCVMTEAASAALGKEGRLPAKAATATATIFAE